MIGDADEVHLLPCQVLFQNTFDITTTTPIKNHDYHHDHHHSNYYYSQRPRIHEILYSNVSLSFWGGIDPQSGRVIDAHHPWYGQVVTDKILCFPSGRGSCTSSQVLLELILQRHAPMAIVLRDVDGLLAVGALVAHEVFGEHKNNDNVAAAPVPIPNLLWTGSHELGLFQELQQIVEKIKTRNTTTTTTTTTIKGNTMLLEDRKSFPPPHPPCFGYITDEGYLYIGSTRESVLATLPDWDSSDISDNDNSGHWMDPIHPKLNLSQDEEHMLQTCQTDAEAMALRVIFRYAQIMGMQDNHDGTTTTRRSYRSINSAHIDGCTYIGPGGLKFVQCLLEAGGQVKVPTTLNAVSADRQQWKHLGVPETYAHNSIALGNVYLNLGCQPSFTCAPYLLNNNKDDNNNNQTTMTTTTTTTISNNPTTDMIQKKNGNGPPKLGQHICWGESNAVVFANSVLGARTAKYADYLDICCAIAGIVPETSVHLDQNRVPSIILDAEQLIQQLEPFMRINKKQQQQQDNKEKQEVVVVEGKDDSVVVAVDDENYDNVSTSSSSWDAFFPVLGHLCGTLSDGKVPLLKGLEPWADRIRQDDLKAFCAAFGTTGTSPLIHIAGITPEAVNPTTVQYWKSQWKKMGWNQQGDNNNNNNNNNNMVRVTLPEIIETFHRLDRDHKQNPPIELIALGNPHLSVTECQQMAEYLLQQQQRRYKIFPNKKNNKVRIMACMSRELYQQADEQGYIAPLLEFGMEFIHDTCWCMLLDPPVIPTTVHTATLTNSGKYAHYGPGLTNRLFRFASTTDCLEAATTGQVPTQRPLWMMQSSSISTNPKMMTTTTTTMKRTRTTTTTRGFCTDTTLAVTVPMKNSRPFLYSSITPMKNSHPFFFLCSSSSSSTRLTSFLLPRVNNGMIPTLRLCTSATIAVCCWYDYTTRWSNRGTDGSARQLSSPRPLQHTTCSTAL